MKAQAIKDITYSWYLKILSNKGSCDFKRIFKYHLQWKSLFAHAFIRLPILIRGISEF